LTFGSRKWRSYILEEEESRKLIHQALDLGINFFDTADMYSLGVSEQILGKALGDFANREEVIIATKVYFPMSEEPNDSGLSRKHIMAAIDNSLRRLGTDYIDLYQIHRWDDHTPIEETLRTLDDLIHMGKVRYIGASSMYAWQLAKSLYVADLHGWTRFVSMQNHYNLVYREEEREMLALCEAEGIGVIPWSPLARGFLAGNRGRAGGGDSVRARDDSLAHELYFEEADFRVLDRVIGTANQRGISPAQISLAWLLHQQAVTSPIVGVRNPNQLEEAVAALEVTLSEKELLDLEELYIPHPVLGFS
jgi:aryl-alcohol dehydrogenase (NADP+)